MTFNPSFKNIGIVCKPRDTRIWAQVKKINDYLDKLGANTLILGSFKTRENLTSSNELIMGQKCDLIIAIGGDGTLLYAGRAFSKFGIPIVGINYGLIGHLNEIEPKNDLASLNLILEGQYTTSSHNLIKHNIKPALGARVGKVAVNDIVIRGSKGISMVAANVKTSEKEFSFRADGIIISTPIGSTSYSQSAGGPVMQSDLNAFVITPICPHLDRVSSYVYRDSEEIKIEINSVKSRASEIYCDGQFCVQIKNPTTIRIKKPKYRLKLIHLNPEK